MLDLQELARKTGIGNNSPILKLYNHCSIMASFDPPIKDRKHFSYSCFG